MRGVFERPPASGCWWINYYVQGKQHREKVGRKSDAVALYQKRKADARAGIKLPDLRRSQAITLGELIDDALEVVARDHKDQRNYITKAKYVRVAFGSKTASDLTPQDIDRWLSSHCKSAATSNRYKAFFSLCYREGIRNRKVTINPARSVPHRREPKGRLRFLSREEYTRLLGIITKRFPEHRGEFIVSVYAGMRLTEQYSTKWNQVDFDRRTIRTDTAKSDRRTIEGRTVHLNAEVIAVLKSLQHKKQKGNDPVFPRESSRFDNRSWFVPCLEEARIEGYVWHSNRHTFCSWLAMAGASIKEIQEAAGHKSITMSARYSHLSQSTDNLWSSASSPRPLRSPGPRRGHRQTQQAPEQAPSKNGHS